MGLLAYTMLSHTRMQYSYTGVGRWQWLGAFGAKPGEFRMLQKANPSSHSSLY